MNCAAILEVDKTILSYPISYILRPILQIISTLSYPILFYTIPYHLYLGISVK